MFDKSHRYSFRKGAPKHVFNLSWCSIRFDKSEDNTFHCAVVVSKKIDKRAVVRNKIKRGLILIISSLVLKTSPNSVVIYVKKPILEKEPTETREELFKAFKTIKII